MNITRKFFGCAVTIGIGWCCLAPAPKARAAGADLAVPAVVQNGFRAWGKQEISSYALDIWKKGGLLEDDKKPATLANYFSKIDRTLGNYKSYDLVDGKRINQSTEILYLAINFEHAAIYARFQLYRTDKDWVVQNMDFSPKPEAIMPWLAFEGTNYEQ
ncbi:MAG: hypothetical protein JWQ04_513 [Pedosphaera sp.]|nr:hypothetical protein [Pedosphaera sp.]